jgi:hypothetical protein
MVVSIPAATDFHIGAVDHGIRAQGAALVALGAEVPRALEVRRTVLRVDELHGVRGRETVIRRRVGRVDLVAGPAVHRRGIIGLGDTPGAGRDPLDEPFVGVAGSTAGGAPLEVPTGEVDGLVVLGLAREQLRVVVVTLGAVRVGVLTVLPVLAGGACGASLTLAAVCSGRTLGAGRSFTSHDEEG